MRQELLREIAEEYLLPFFSGAVLEARAPRSTPREDVVSYANLCTIAFKASRADDYRLLMTRSQPFTKSHKDVVPEIEIVRAFVRVVSLVSSIVETDLRSDILSTFQRRVVSSAILGGRWQEAILAGIDRLDQWGSRLYEGGRQSLRPSGSGTLERRSRAFPFRRLGGKISAMS